MLIEIGLTIRLLDVDSLWSSNMASWEHLYKWRFIKIQLEDVKWRGRNHRSITMLDYWKVQEDSIYSLQRIGILHNKRWRQMQQQSTCVSGIKLCPGASPMWKLSSETSW